MDISNFSMPPVPASPGNSLHGTAYLIEIHAYNQEPIFGTVSANKMVLLNELGQIAAAEWVQTSRNRQDIELCDWTMLTNGLRGIVVVKALNSASSGLSYGSGQRLTKPRSLSAFITRFKAAAAKRINLHRNHLGMSVWQPSYSNQVLNDPKLLHLTRQRLQQYGHPA